MIDYGSRAPAGIFVEVFKRHGVALTPAEARGPMGMEKRAHIASLADLPTVQRRWREANGCGVAERDIDIMYEEFLPLQMECLPRFADLVPGTLDVVERYFRSPRRNLPGIQDHYNRKGLISERGQRKQAFLVLRAYYERLATTGR